MKKINKIIDALGFLLASIILFGGCSHTLFTLDCLEHNDRITYIHCCV